MKKVTLELDQVQYQILCDALCEFMGHRVGYYLPGTPNFHEVAKNYVDRRYPTFNTTWRAKKTEEVVRRIDTCDALYNSIVEIWHEEGN